MKQFEKSIYSQWGECGVIEEIFKRIGITNKIAMDVGAWDGVHFSNTLYMAEEYGFTRILCESDVERANMASNNFQTSQVFGHCDNIDSILSVCKCPEDIDLLSIDVDGDDYYLWKDMVKFRPRVVVIEYNQTVPPGISVVQERGGSFGASWKALVDLATEKNYKICHTTTTNIVFIDGNMRGVALWPTMPSDWLQYIITGYNGKQYRIGKPAHNDDQGGKHEKLISDVEIVPI